MSETLWDVFAWIGMICTFSSLSVVGLAAIMSQLRERPSPRRRADDDWSQWGV